jgi:hypothetical protein
LREKTGKNTDFLILLKKTDFLVAHFVTSCIRIYIGGGRLIFEPPRRLAAPPPPLGWRLAEQLNDLGHSAGLHSPAHLTSQQQQQPQPQRAPGGRRN